LSLDLVEEIEKACSECGISLDEFFTLAVEKHMKHLTEQLEKGR
jgi:hypothetical protein